MYTIILLIAVYLGGGPSGVQVKTIKQFVQPGKCEQMVLEMQKNPEAKKYHFSCQAIRNWSA